MFKDDISYSSPEGHREGVVMLYHHDIFCLTMPESIIHHVAETKMLCHLDNTCPRPYGVSLGLPDLDSEPLEEGVVRVHHLTGHHSLLRPEFPTLDPIREDEKGAGAEVLHLVKGSDHLVNQFCRGMTHNRRGH